jgi:hypothetical protein
MPFSEDFGGIQAEPGYKSKHGYKWGLLKVREREIQMEHGRAQVVLLLFRCF